MPKPPTGYTLGADPLDRARQLFAGGRFAEAGVAAGAALKRDPRNPVALRLAGLCQARLGHHAEAAPLLERAIAADPTSAFAECDLGMSLVALSRLEAAEPHFQAAIRLRPNFPEAFLNLGNLYLQRGQGSDAARCYSEALALRPDFPQALLSAAVLQLEVGRTEEAAANAQRALELAPALAETHRIRGRVFGQQRRYADAVAAYERAVAIDPALATAHAELGMLHRNFGHRAAAVAALERTLAVAPSMTNLLPILLELRQERATDAQLDELKRRYADPGLPAVERVHLGFALGEAHEKLGAYGPALDYFIAANALHRGTISYDTAETIAEFEELQRAFPGELLTRRRAQSSTGSGIIFIVGMPRSGTTLTEQILASHPDVHGGGETLLLPELTASLWGRPGQVQYQTLVESVGEAGLDSLGRDFERRSLANAGGRRFVTEKLPDNFRLLGLIAAALPGAQIVHCRRDPADTALSIFKQFFTGRIAYAYDLAELAAYYRLYDGLMQHWDDVLPRLPHVVRMEALIADQRGETERLLAYLGLPWDDAVLDFFRTERPVTTVSSLQVREPINDRGVGIAARYGAGLDPLRRALATTSPDV